MGEARPRKRGCSLGGDTAFFSLEASEPKELQSPLREYDITRGGKGLKNRPVSTHPPRKETPSHPVCESSHVRTGSNATLSPDKHPKASDLIGCVYIYMVHFKAMVTLVIHIRNHKKKLRTKMYIIHLYIYFLHRGKKAYYKKINTTGFLVYR